VAEHRTLAAGQYRCHRVLERQLRRPADRVDATVNAVQVALADSVRDLSIAQTEIDKLAAGDVAVLTACDDAYAGAKRDLDREAP
jgi:hypothetical protein